MQVCSIPCSATTSAGSSAAYCGRQGRRLGRHHASRAPIEPFGAAVNAVCGSPGKVTSKTKFKEMLETHPEIFTATMEYTGGKVFADRAAHRDANSYLDDLTEA